jgi:hypothetical protein
MYEPSLLESVHTLCSLLIREAMHVCHAGVMRVSYGRHTGITRVLYGCHTAAIRESYRHHTGKVGVSFGSLTCVLEILQLAAFLLCHAETVH